MTVELTMKGLQEKVKAVHAAGGGIDDVVAHFYPELDKKSADWKKAKAGINSKISDLRKTLKAQCEEKGIPVERIEMVLPYFREVGTPGPTDKEETVSALLDLMSAADGEETDATAE